MIFDLSTLGDHQHEGLHNCIEGFKVHDRLQAHMACGTGKTRLGQAVAYELESKTTLLLFPSLPLIGQTLESWMLEGRIAHEDVLCVCSDQSVADLDEQDDIVEIPISVTTLPQEVTKFFSSRDDSRETYIFCTYHSLPSLATGLPTGLVFDLCIFDEAHRVAGNVDKIFSYGLNNHIDLRIDKRLFLTATPRLITTEEGEEGQVYSMSNEDVFGPVVYELSLHDAIERGIVCDYQIVISIQDESLVDKSLVNTFDHELIFKAASLLQTMENVSARKAFTFHQRISYSKHFSQALKIVSDHMSKSVQAWHVDGAMSDGERHSILKRFSEAPSAVVSCSRCLSEGTNVPVTDLVAFMDPRSSDTDIIQTLGRALRKAPGKKMGYVLIPLRLIEGESVEKMLESSSMRHIWRVLGSLAEMDSRYITQLRTIRREMPVSTWSKASIEVLDKVVIKASRDVTEQAYRSLKFKLIDRLTSRWDSSFGELIRFGKKHGHLRVPKRHITQSGFRLGVWCTAQRNLAKTGMLDSRRRSDLIKAGFDFDPYLSSWEEAFSAVLEYREKYGSVDVPQSHITDDGFSLGDWCSDQRKAKKNGKLDPNREIALIEAGFSFTPAEDAWASKYARLKDLVSTHGSVKAALDADCEGLRTWLDNQRLRRIPAQRRGLLESIGVTFLSRADEAWQNAFDLLEAYLKSNQGEHPPLSFKSPNGFALGNWISNQRQAYASGKMPADRAEKLLKIGFIFNLEEAAFERGIEELRAYNAIHGHCKVPTNFVSSTGFKLGSWLSNVKSRMKKAPNTHRLIRLRSEGVDGINIDSMNSDLSAN